MMNFSKYYLHSIFPPLISGSAINF
uniref:Uncharacterized protein n=1 Tax=Anguilla anguilla TaxID=7936 RepID=A0A0E9UTU3_ANGAN